MNLMRWSYFLLFNMYENILIQPLHLQQVRQLRQLRQRVRVGLCVSALLRRRFYQCPPSILSLYQPFAFQL